MTTLIFILVILASFLITLGAAAALVFINQRLINLLKKSTLLMDEIMGRDTTIIKRSLELETSFYRVVREKHAIAKMAEELLTRKDTEIQHLIGLVKQKKLRVKHK